MDKEITKTDEADTKGSSNFVPNSQITLVDHLTHELRTPVHGILNIAHFLSDNWVEIEDADKLLYINKINASCNYLKSLLDEMLTLSETGSSAGYSDWREEDLVRLLNESIEQCHGLYLTKPELKMHNITTVSKAAVYADKFRINQLLLNLLSNAIKYSNTGVITVQVSDFQDNSGYYWRCDIKDQGVGVPADEMEIIFDPFVRSTRISNDKGFKGTGLGLAICHEIAHNHKGRIWATNNTNGEKGTTFSFIIPQHTKDAVH